VAEDTLRMIYISPAHSIITYGTILWRIRRPVIIFFIFKKEHVESLLSQDSETPVDICLKN